jgi:Na+/H+ antiporter NhaD/arsenite permease-like protein
MEYAELMLFLIVAMTYINAMEERHLFDWLRDRITDFDLGLRSLFWLTGILSFCIAPIADNLTTALLMCSVVMAVGVGNPVFISAACVNIVVAANAGGAFSPFGDITTLMVWQKGKLDFFVFFQLFLPSVVNFIIPAICISLTIPNDKPQKIEDTTVLKYGAGTIVALFLLTIATAVTFHSVFHIPPVAGMMFGLGYLSMYSYYLSHKISVEDARSRTKADAQDDWEAVSRISEVAPFNVFSQISRSHWDTLIFFYGVVLCVGGLGFIGYLELVSSTMYEDYGATFANICVGFLSALVDNIPVMFAVLTMDPQMDEWQWLLVTLTAGVGGSLLSIGSAAGVALMGQAHGYYTFFGHLKWSWAILLGYAASILTHYWLNGGVP